MNTKTIQTALPVINKPLLGGFRVFNRKYLRKHFHTLAVNRESLSPPSFGVEDSLVVYANHASWWDPLAALFLAEEIFPGFRMYAPIDKLAFQKYRIFGQMGFFPVEQTSLQGAKEFLRITREILSQPAASVWITPEGRFVDVRETTAPFMPGLSHLASSLATRAGTSTKSNSFPIQVWFVPAALEYTFWEERLPELLVWLGQPLCVTAEEVVNSNQPNRKESMNQTLRERLRDAQTQLAAAAQSRDTSKFEVFLQSSGSTFFLYDWMRRFSCLLTGKEFDASHSDKFSVRKD